jgi:hypothetical protein
MGGPHVMDVDDGRIVKVKVELPFLLLAQELLRKNKFDKFEQRLAREVLCDL